MEKHNNADRLRDEHHRDLARKVMLRQEKDQLRFHDAQKNMERQKWQMTQQKLKILDKHTRIGERLNSLK